MSLRTTFLRAASCGIAAVLLQAIAAAAVDTGSADFTSYVAIGDSLTAGFNSGGLVEKFQRESYPALLARQATGGQADFEQPLVSAPGLPALFELKSFVPLIIAPKAGMGQPINLNLARPYNNLAVPGANTHDALAKLTDNGGPTDLILRGFGTQLQQALALHPTFVTVWLGSNDALAAATSGIVIDDVTLTSAARFEADYRAIVGALAASGARLALANVPTVTVIPFVTTVPPVLVDPTTRQPVLINGQPVPLIGPQGPLAPNDHVLLTAQTLLAQGIGIPRAAGGTGAPLPDKVVLSAAEAAKINDRVASFNNVIQAVATETGAALVDTHAFLDRAASSGLIVGGIPYTTAFLTGGIFSFDGVHPTAFGYAEVANLFIRSINAHFGAAIPVVDLSPFVFGEEGRALGITPEEATGARLSDSALRNLRWSLNVPPPGRLERLNRDRSPEPPPTAGGVAPRTPLPPTRSVSRPTGRP